MERKFRVRKRGDFLSAYKSGLKYRADFFVAVAGINLGCDGVYRAGFTASKKVGNAVVRNRCKRRMRAMTRQLLPSLGIENVDYIFIAKKSMILAKWDDFISQAKAAITYINSEIKKCEKAGLLR